MQFTNNGRSENGSSLCPPLRAGPRQDASGIGHLQELTASLGSRSTGRKRALLRIVQSVSALTSELDPAFRLYGRIKSFRSILAKMLDYKLDVNQILDIIGVRVITRRQQNCYRLIRRVHSEFHVLANEYDDYIATPKPNGYRSIHTTIVSPCGFAAEIQVRTHSMHEICERGSAAHSVYKKNRVAWISLLPGSHRLGGIA